MRKSSKLAFVALLASAALVITGCSSSSEKASGGTKACVILPDSASSPRWENGDRPAIQSALADAGFDSDIQNAEGDTTKYGTIADQQLAGGCGVMILVNLQGAAEAVTTKAKAQGIPVIAYDRPIAGADYYVSFDNEGVGALEGQAIVDGLKAAGKDPATASVVYVGGDPTDGNAKMFYDGAVSVMSAAGIKPAFETPGTWDGAKAGTAFEQAYSKLEGKIDAVWVANDTNAAAVIQVLDKNGMTLPVSGQDASVAGLQNVLLGKQTTTVWKPYTILATAATDLAIALLKGEKPTVNKTLADGTPFSAQTPINVTPDQVKDVVAAGDAVAAEICTDNVKAACEMHGVK